MLHNLAQPELGAFALQIQRPAWIGDAPQSPKSAHELTCSGIGPNEVPIHARRDGFIIFDFPASTSFAGGAVPPYIPEPGKKIPGVISEARRQREALGYRRFEYMNAFLGALYSGYSTVQKTGTMVQEPAHPTNYWYAEKQDGTFKIYGQSAIDPITTHRSILETATVDHAVELMNKCFETFENQTITLLSLVYLSCHLYRNHQFASAHLIAWGVIEKQINFMWEELLKTLDLENGGHTAISRERKKLFAGRDYTASVICQMLSLHNRITDDMLERLNDARKRRNEFAHSLAAISA